MNNSEIEALLQYDLTKVIEDMVYYVDLIDGNYYNKPNNFIMRYWQLQDVTFKQILLADLLDWLCCLALSDGFIAREEIQFINLHLKQRLSRNEIIELCRVRIDQDYFNRLPLSFALLYEDDMVMNSLEDDVVYNNVEKLYMLFMIIGVQFIYCDNDVDLKELIAFKGYIDSLSKRIVAFDLKSEQLAILEMLSEHEEFRQNEESFNENTFDDYYERLNQLATLENIKEENSQNDFDNNISANPWDDKIKDIPTNQWQSSEIKSNSPWNVEINPNDRYNFSGEFKNHLNNFQDIFTPENHYKLENVHLTSNQYRSILNKIKSASDDILNEIINENNIDFNSLSILEKILLFTKSFVDVDYKAAGADLGNYAFNKINLDDRLDTANQITTLIHELSHHLLAEIFEQAVMILFDTDKTDAVESYVGFSLMCANPSILLNEYCAHTVEGRFTPHGYQDYGSFENILQKFDPQRDKEIVSVCMMVGNTFCQDLLAIIEPFIDYNLREEIKEQFKKDFSYPPNYRGISLEIKNTLPINNLLEFINFILLTGFNEALKNPEFLFDYKTQFKLHNKKSRL